MKFGRTIIELHDFCNRKCDWCICSVLKQNKIEYMSDEIFYKTIDEIYKNIDLFNVPLAFSLFRYNEPLYDIHNLIIRAKYIKEFFKHKNIPTFIYIHTNGDYLNNIDFDDFNGIIDEIRINDYENNGEANYVLSKMLGMKNKLIPISIEINKDERNQFICKYKNIDIIFYMNSGKNLLKMTKGSVMQDYNDTTSISWCNNAIERDYDCDLKGKIFVVETNGDVMGCCEVYNKIKKHSDMIMGNIKDGIQNFINCYDYIDEHTFEACKYCHMSSKHCAIIRQRLGADNAL